MKQARKRTTRKIVLVSAFADAPDAKGMLARYEVPAKLAKRGFYVALDGTVDWLFDKHPERALPAGVGDAGLQLILALIDDAEARRILGGELCIGFHAELDARALAKAFTDEGFVVQPAPISRVAGLAYGASDPWPAAVKLLASGTALADVLGALRVHDELAPPSAKVLTALAKHVATRAELVELRLVLGHAGADLTTAALPLVRRRFAPAKARARPRGLPPELATLLGACKSIPELGVLSAADVTHHHQRLLRLAKGPTRVGKRDWGATPAEVRIDRFWRDRWIPFCQRPDDEMLAIDLDPAARGTRGQVIGVHLNPPTLRRYRATLGEWLWHELEQAWR